MRKNPDIYIDKVLRYALIFFIALLVLTSCSPAKYVPEGNYLLSKNKLETTQKSISEEKLKTYIVQKPNKKIIGVRFHLWLYNLSNIKKNRWPHNWLRRIGEEPVIYNPALTTESVKQLGQFLENKGYYHAVVEDSVTFHHKYARVYYRIDPHNAFRISNITYSFEDTGIIRLLLPDTVNSLIKREMKFDKDILQNERVRIETFMKEHGYFRFSKEYIYFQAVLNEKKSSVDLAMGIKEFVEGKTDPLTKIKPHPKFRIGKVFVFPDFRSINNPEREQAEEMPYDTLRYQDLYFLTKGESTLRPPAIASINYITPGQYYKQSDVNKTYRNLSELGPIRFVNISFKENDSISESYTEKTLEAQIELTRKKVQSFQTEVAGTNSGGDLGIRGNLSYQNLNLLRGAEIFNIRFTGAIEALNNRSDKKYTSMKEVGVESNIVFPKFFSPFRLEGFVKRYSPKTSISAAFNYQARPDFTRSIANGSFSYKWSGKPNLRHTIWPIEINYVQIYENRSSQEFIDSIKNTPLGYSFEDHLVNVFRYGFELNNQAIATSKDFVFLSFNIESAGNLVNVANKTFQQKTPEQTYLLFNVPYFQYMRGEIDLRYYNIFDRQNTFAYRLYLGLGYPYGNSRTLPFEKKFFSGGPNSIRAWSSRDLGPGSDTTRSDVIFNSPNKSGDIKLEGNVEYRFKVIWKMEAAIFLDAGNIWEIRPDPDKPGALFSWNRFYKEVALGTGLGARFDFSFFLLRFDFGLKVRDPARPENDRWLPVFRNFAFNHFNFNFGIGYPF